MGYYFAPDIGDKGICPKDSCKHKDCALWHKQMQEGCSYCKQPIKPGTKIMYRDSGLDHCLCVWEAEEKRRTA